MLRRLLYVVILLLGFDAQAQSQGVAVEQPWARATPGRAPTGAAYLTLVNRGKDADRLMGATTPAATRVEFHAYHRPEGTAGGHTGHQGHVMEMRPIGQVEIKPGETVILKPDGVHVMLVGLKAPLKEGERLALTLRFERAGEVKIEVPIARAGAMGPPK
ncbi:MAG: copper chaperone PCu(A)C [Alphaproteobacteria bacterium]|nr:copper chaperone PCu(A)C [Alphaproteobacteria bacterium]